MAKNNPPTAPKADATETGGTVAVPNAIEVFAKAGSFYRLGRHFTSRATQIALADLSSDDLATLRAEPKLIVRDAVIE